MPFLTSFGWKRVSRLLRGQGVTWPESVSEGVGSMGGGGKCSKPDSKSVGRWRLSAYLISAYQVISPDAQRPTASNLENQTHHKAGERTAAFPYNLTFSSVCRVVSKRIFSL